MHATTNIAADLSTIAPRRLGRIAAFTSYLRLLRDVYREARIMQRAAHARWPHIDG